MKTLSAVLFACSLLPAQRDDTITYQGRLRAAGAPVNGTADARFSLYDDLIGGQLVDGPLLRPSIPVADGVFSVSLGFDPNVFDGRPLYLHVEIRYPAGGGVFVPMTPRQQLSSAPFALKTRGIVYAENDRRLVLGDDRSQVGIGIDQPRSRLHVIERETEDHVAVFENLSRQAGADGILIRIDNGLGSTNRENNFVEFQNGNGRVVGRIEGFDTENRDWVVPPPIPDARFNVRIDPGELPSITISRGRLPRITSFDPGALPTLNCVGGAWPSAQVTSPGSFPTIDFQPGALPSLTWHPVTVLPMTFTPGTLPSLTGNGGSFPSWELNGGSFPTCTLAGGRLPSIQLDRGQFPTIDFDPGQLPSLSGFDLGLPNPLELQALICWAVEQGMTAPLSVAATYGLAGPQGTAAIDLAMQAALACKDEGVVYGSRGADYAEWLPKRDADAEFQLGQVVGVRGGRVSLDTRDAEQLMVVSCKPIVLGNVPEAGEVDNYVKVAFMGQVPVVVRGSVRAGDFIIPSELEDGTAVAVSPAELDYGHVDRIVGRAWSDGESDVYSMVNVVVGVEDSAAELLLKRQRSTMDGLVRANGSLREELEALRGEQVAMQQRLADIESVLATLAPSAEAR